MRAVIQRVSKGSVTVGNEYYQEIKNGIVLLLGININDEQESIKKLADKIINLRIFNDENEKLNLSLKDVNGDILIISQFTLFGDTRRGNRPSFTESASADKGKLFYEKFIDYMKLLISPEKVKTGIFGAMMKVEIINEGPVTIIMDM